MTRNKEQLAANRTGSGSVAESAAFTPRRGRPDARQAAAISETILAAATQLFLSRGYEGVSMEAIAAAAGIPKSTLYKRYRDKKSLVRAVVEHRVSTWSAIQTRENPTLPADLEGRLKRHAETALVWTQSGEVRALSRLAAGTWDGAAEVAGTLHQMGYQHLVNYLEQEIREFGEADGHAVKDPAAVATTLLALLSGWLATRPPGVSIPREETRAFACKAVELIMFGRAAW